MLTEEQIRNAIANVNSRVDWNKVPKDVAFEDMGLDSLDQFEVIVAVQEAAGKEIPDDDVAGLESIADLESYFADK